MTHTDQLERSSTPHTTPSVADTTCEVANTYLHAHPGVAATGTTVIVGTPNGDTEVTAGDPEELDCVYMHGQCHALALAIYENIGGELVGVGRDTCELAACNHPGQVCEEQLWHIAVRHGEIYIDGEGIHTTPDTLGVICSEDTPTVHELDPQTLHQILWTSTNWARPNMEAARSVVGAALEELETFGPTPRQPNNLCGSTR